MSINREYFQLHTIEMENHKLLCKPAYYLEEADMVLFYLQ